MSALSEKLEARLPAFLSGGSRFLVSRPVDRDRKITKPPYRISDGQLFDAWHPKPGDLGSLTEAIKAVNSGRFEWVGLCISGSPLVCVDLDHCFLIAGNSASNLKPWACEFVEAWRRFIYYAEVSVRGDGLHLWLDLRATPKFPANVSDADLKKKRYLKCDGGQIELFLANYCTISGSVWGAGWGETPLDAESYKQVLRVFEKTPTSAAAPVNGSLKKYEYLLSDDSEAAGFTDRSAADLALCSRLARLGMSPREVELIWKKALPREKLQRRDYVTATISKAFERLKTIEAEVDPATWRESCFTKDTLPKKKSEYLIDGLVAKNALTFYVAPSYNCKTWASLMSATPFTEAYPCGDSPSPQTLPSSTVFPRWTQAAFIATWTSSELKTRRTSCCVRWSRVCGP